MTTETLKIIKVQFFSDVFNKYCGNHYTYYSVDDLQVGDVVNVPAKDRVGKAKVTYINVPEDEVAKYKFMLKVIPAGSLVKEVTPAEEFPDDVPLFPAMVGETALIKVDPLGDPSIIPFIEQVNKLKQYAQIRVIASDADLKSATEDLVTMSTLKKSITGKYKEWTGPINDHLTKVREAFNQLTSPLTDADVTTRQKIQDYRAAQEKRRQEAEEINRQKEELAQKEAAFTGTGEITVDVTPVPVPEVVSKVRTEIGNLGTMKVRKYRIVDFAKLSDMYKIENSALLNKVTKAGIPEITGVEFFFEETLTVRSR